MPQQGTEEQSSSEQSSSDQETSGKHRSSSDEANSSEQTTEQQQSTGGQSSEQQSSDGETTQKQEAAPSEAPTEKQQQAPSEAPTEKQQQAPSEAPTQQQRTQGGRGGADTSWADREESRPKRSVDLGELAWRTGNVIATVVRTLALLFALVLIVNVVLLLVGVNPANGVAQFVAGVADVVILGFRDLFLPADPTVALIVNSLVAAVFWVFLGELASRLIRFVAARVK
ncbi:hypothetical protein WCD74_21755 [Actinomycetospora sp. OC33-EN08]|uniref:Uncharacterized protein n=1 Tax=Actinomycetospora aurantiaca TaxID=3129233 RepID=A0ABU8MU26_9PSEU